GRAVATLGRRRSGESGPDAGNEQRVPRGPKLHAAIRGERRFDTIGELRELRLRLYDIDLGRRLECPLQLQRTLSKPIAQREQDASDLLRLLFFERDEVVVDLDGAERFEKEARATRRAAVH